MGHSNVKSKLGWSRGLLLLGALVTTALAVGQDYPALQGSSQRQGKNTGPGLSGPGRALLTWFAPAITDEYGRNLIRNNTSSEVTTTGTWTNPTETEEAFGAFGASPAVPASDPVNAAENLLRGLDPITLPYPGYAYSATIPSAAGTDPTIKNFAADTKSLFTWTVQPPTGAFPNQRLPRNYALSIWLPGGPTDVAGTLRFSARFYVVEVVYDGTQVFRDVIDTFAAGTGWVRIGNGGLPTTRVFGYNGTDAIQIRLHNTLVRRPGRENDVVSGPGYNFLNTYFDNPYTTLVYADAVKAVPTSGAYSATPLVSRTDQNDVTSPIYAFGTRNNITTGVEQGRSVTITKGELTAHNYQTGASVWRWSPLDESTEFTSNYDNTNGAVTSSLPWAIPGTTVAPFQGTNYLTAPITNTLGTEQAVRYEPNDLDNGSYEILVFCPGTRGTENLAAATEIRVLEGATVVATIPFNQDAARGWVRLSTRRFTNTAANRLSVQITNYSANVADLGRFAHADAIRFVGATNLAIDSTPVIANALVRVTNGGPATDTGVVVVGGQDGRLYCVDARGNGDGTTNVYWAYPTVPDPDVTNWTDPNHVLTEDGVGGIAENPRGFDLSSALIERIGGRDYLFIASRNGRVYCIEMEGRGDMDLGRRYPGSTRRVWTYPDDYPAPAIGSRLGAFRGSLTFATTAAGPTIFAPTSQGRLYALEALPAVVTNKTTTVRWTFPPRTSPTVGPIRMTPLAADGRVFFGTATKTGDDRGRFFALNWDTGAQIWQFDGTTAWSTTAAFVRAGDFIGGPAYAANNQVGAGQPPTIFVANENGWISSFDATNGTLLWTTDELATGVSGNLTFTNIDAFTGGGAGARANATVVMLPTNDGRFSGLYALPGTGLGATNRFGTKRAWEYSSTSEPVVSSLATGRNWMYGGDLSGFLYGFNDLGNGSGDDIDGPGERTIVENDDSDPNVEAFRDAKIIFVTRETYQRLRLPQTDPTMLTRAQALDVSRLVTRTAFDWGETIYAMVYDFPYRDTYAQGALAGSPAPPPVVNYQWTVEGNSIRNLSVEGRKFAGTSPANRDGYAIVAYVLQGAGSNALPPGPGRASFTVSTSALTNPPRPINIAPNPAASRRPFAVANPIGIIMGAGAAFQVGNNPDPSLPENLVNGNPSLGTVGRDESRMTAPAGVGSHGGNRSVEVGVVDRSMMILLRGDGRGLDNIRVERGDLAWQGGKASVLKPIDSNPFYAAFWGTGKGLEAYPVNFPNDSPDYPDIARERVRVTKDPNGVAENPIFNAISLIAPTVIDENALPFPTRTLNPTTFELSLDIPRFQPPNNSTVLDSAGNAVPGGFYGNIAVFVDTNGDGSLTKEGGRRETFRSFWLASGVAVDEQINIANDTVDFGSLAHSTGYDTATPTSGAGTFSPWAGAFTDLFKPITISNEGNVNILNLRLAKKYDNGVLNPWEIFGAGNHELAWLSGATNLHATFDQQFSLTPNPIIPKARPGDLNPTQFRDNPRVRDNPTIGAVGGPLLPASPDPDSPRIAVTVPFGFPVGLYQSIIRVIEDGTDEETDQVDGNGTSLTTSDDLQIKVTSRETRMTNTSTRRTAIMIDDLIGNGSENFLHQNQHPTGVRVDNGDLITAFSSDRFNLAGTGFDKPLPAARNDNPQLRIYLSAVDGIQPIGGAPLSTPLRDLNAFTPNSATRWFNRAVADYPTTPPATLFPGDPPVADTAQFGLPTFPQAGFRSPFGAAQPFMYMAFLGNVQKQGTDGRYPESRIFLSEVRSDGVGGVTAGAPIAINGLDVRNRKGRMSVVQNGDDATVFYTVGGTGQSQIQSFTYTGNANVNPRLFDTGAAFDWVSNPSAILRTFNGVGLPNGNLYEMTFTGKLRGRPNTEVFLSRIPANGLTPGNPAFFPAIDQEILQADTSESGVYRSRGVRWNVGAVTGLFFRATPTSGVVNVEVPNTRTFDRNSGILSFDLTIGGRAFINMSAGIVRISNGLPNRGSQLLLTYQPRFLRISATTGSYTTPQIMYDNRFIGETSYWATSVGNAVTPPTTIRPGRTFISYGRGSEGNQSSRPYWQTLRAGIQLPTAIATAANGSIVNITVTGATSNWQVDPANGRVYFTSADEGRTVNVAFTGVDVNGAPVTFASTAYTVGLLTETEESPILIEQSVNESQPWLNLDPFEITDARGERRPGLVWMFWVSTRAGGSDVYFQTLAPRFTPISR